MCVSGPPWRQLISTYLLTDESERDNDPVVEGWQSAICYSVSNDDYNKQDKVVCDVQLLKTIFKTLGHAIRNVVVALLYNLKGRRE